MITKAKAEFSAVSKSVFGVTWSFKNHSIVWFGAQETFLWIFKVQKNSIYLKYKYFGAL